MITDIIQIEKQKKKLENEIERLVNDFQNKLDRNIIVVVYDNKIREVGKKYDLKSCKIKVEI